MSLAAWLAERTGRRHDPAPVDALPAAAPSAGRTLVPLLGFLFLVELVTGLAMAMYYSPSSTDAWASVAYLEDQVPMGSFVRGVHRWGMSAIVLVIGMHLLVTAVAGAHRRPRELVWWLGIGLFVVSLGYSLTGFVLRWDQYGYWATNVELQYVAAGPGGRVLVPAVQGGNAFGNLTLTRAYALHVVALPALTLLLWWGQRALSRRLPVAGAPVAARRAWWRDQRLYDLAAMAVVLAALVAWTVHRGGAGLEAPADATSTFDARPQWYFRPLYELQKHVPASLSLVVALGLPALVLGVLVALPFLDRGGARTPARRWGVTGALVAFVVATAVVVVVSYRADGADDGLRERRAEGRALAAKARRLAVEHGVPVGGGVAVYTTAPFHLARTAWARECAACHEEGEDRKGPLITAGWNDRAWIRGLLVDPSHDLYFGRTRLAKAEDAMPPTRAPDDHLDALAEWLYAEAGGQDADPTRVARGRELFDSDDDDGDGEDDDGSCTACHEREGTEASSGPNLAGRGTPDHLAAFIRNPAEPRFFGARDEMKAFGRDRLSDAELWALVEYLTWLRTATPADVAALDD